MSGTSYEVDFVGRFYSCRRYNASSSTVARHFLIGWRWHV